MKRKPARSHPDSFYRSEPALDFEIIRVQMLYNEGSFCFRIFAIILIPMFARICNSFEKFPNANSFCISNTLHTYKDLGQRINGIVKVLEDINTRNIGIVSYDDIETYAGILGTLFSGKTFIPLNPSHPGQRNAAIIEQAEITVLLTSRPNEAKELFPEKNSFRIISSENLQSEKHHLSAPKVAAEQNAYILFTSGSTGIPKGVPVQHKNLEAFVKAFFLLDFELSEKDRFLQMFDLTFDLSIFSFLIPLCLGACIYTVPSGEVKYTSVYSVLEEYQITVALMVPSVLNFLKKYFSEIRLDQMRYSLFCGETLFSDLVSQWAKCIPGAQILNVYGPTEATVFCLAYHFDNTGANKETNGIVCIGKPMDGVLALIVDENLVPVQGEIYGELCLAGDQLTSGYLKNPEKNTESFFKYSIDGIEHILYRTGDICRKDNDGEFHFLGRIDNQVKIQGYRIELNEIEFYSREFTGNINTAAFALQNATGNMIIFLMVEDFYNIESLASFLKTKLPPYMIPSEIRSVKKFPLNSNGKVDRKALQKMVIQ